MYALLKKKCSYTSKTSRSAWSYDTKLHHLSVILVSCSEDECIPSFVFTQCTTKWKKTTSVLHLSFRRYEKSNLHFRVSCHSPEGVSARWQLFVAFKALGKIQHQSTLRWMSRFSNCGFHSQPHFILPFFSSTIWTVNKEEHFGKGMKKTKGWRRGAGLDVCVHLTWSGQSHIHPTRRGRCSFKARSDHVCQSAPVVGQTRRKYHESAITFQSRFQDTQATLSSVASVSLPCLAAQRLLNFLVTSSRVRLHRGGAWWRRRLSCCRFQRRHLLWSSCRCPGGEPVSHQIGCQTSHLCQFLYLQPERPVFTAAHSISICTPKKTKTNACKWIISMQHRKNPFSSRTKMLDVVYRVCTVYWHKH